MSDRHPDFSLQSYDFVLPAERIAQYPASERSLSRLMVLERSQARVSSALFADLLRFLPERCLLVANNSRVIPARIQGLRHGGGKMEFLLLTPPPLLTVRYSVATPLFPGWKRAEAEALLKPAAKVQTGEIISFSDDFAVEVLERGPYGRCRVSLAWRGNLQQIFERQGTIPLPPYIRRPSRDEPPSLDQRASDLAMSWGTDKERYQTVYARKEKAGSVAAPTAGLHFTQAMREEIEASGREWAEVTLYVGYGTFSPVRCEDIREHQMHAEYVEISAQSAERVLRAKSEGRPVIAVGTSSCRVLEGVYERLRQPEQDRPASRDEQPAAQPKEQGREQRPDQELLREFSGDIDTFLYPGKSFHVVDGLITNFHLPESSLLMLVSAFAGREFVLSAYERAVAES
ncbi:S-adenosylmethionine:tRNA ribosyltransferase-isomerase, partial [Desulfovibrio sp. OttesenSCG-928-A18]|nr:S-adenosylmethionine:tRNA ribosyltransferase-isomerase [Desulfovibrio sp. OttesenSCG-928-A18]